MVKIAPSFLSADFRTLENQVRLVEDAGAEYIHLDIMDGHFVPNITFGALVVEAIRKTTDLVLEVHLMISEPGKYLQNFADAGTDILTVHVEVEEDVPSLLDRILKANMKAGATLRPGHGDRGVIPAATQIGPRTRDVSRTGLWRPVIYASVHRSGAGIKSRNRAAGIGCRNRNRRGHWCGKRASGGRSRRAGARRGFGRVPRRGHCKKRTGHSSSGNGIGIFRQLISCLKLANPLYSPTSRRKRTKLSDLIMFEMLTERLNGVFKQLRSRGRLSESNIDDAMREVRRALLEADVNYKVARSFIARVKERAIGREVLKSITPGQQVVKIVHDELIALMGNQNAALQLAESPPSADHDGRASGIGQNDLCGKIGPAIGGAKQKSPARGGRYLSPRGHRSTLRTRRTSRRARASLPRRHRSSRYLHASDGSGKR